MYSTIRKLWHRKDGLTTLEYVLLVLLIVAVAVLAWNLFSMRVGKIVETGTNSF